MNRRKSSARFFFGPAILLALAVTAWAETFPSRPKFGMTPRAAGL